jgi:dehydrogenase/reductase SDR family member 12
MVCRSPGRATKARDEIMAKTNNPNVQLLMADCGLEADIRRIVEEFVQHRKPSLPEGSPVTLNGLVCNAGALLNEKTLTSEGVEVTFATHLLFGTYLLGELLMPHLEASDDGRIACVSSGGMYNSKFPAWEDATSSGIKKYDGQFVYTYAKRGQVLLCEEWQKLHPKLKVISCHPGWTATEAVDAAYGDDKKYLEPLRTPWQGAEGIIWLFIAPSNKIEGGAFYLDRQPRVKHLSGAFFSEGNFTKNSPEEVRLMMENLHKWSHGPSRPSLEDIAKKNALALPSVGTSKIIDIQRFMGRWYVAANIPTFLEVGASNCVESYQWDNDNNIIQVFFEYVSKGSQKPSESLMRARIANAPVNSQWALNLKVGLYLPFDLTYLIVDIADDYSWASIGVPDRSYFWILVRERPVYLDELAQANKDAESSAAAAGASASATTEESIIEKHERQERVLEQVIARAQELGYDASKIQRIPWLKSLEYEPRQVYMLT